MSVGVEVDALALMLDGYNSGPVRVADDWVALLEYAALEAAAQGKQDSTHVANRGWAEVAEAILELEALADWDPLRQRGSQPTGDLADSALDEVDFWNCGDRTVESLNDTIREAAAILRDGWRPSGWKAGSR